MDDFTIKPRLEKLNIKIEDTKSQLQEQFKRQEDVIFSAITQIKSDVTKDLNEHLKQCSDINAVVNSKLATLSQRYFDRYQNFDQLYSNKYEQKQSELDLKYNNFTTNLENKLATLNTKVNTTSDLADIKLSNFENSVNSKLLDFTERLNRIQFDIIHNEDNISITYVNADGKLEYGSIKKVLPDDKTIKMDKDNKLYLNYVFDSKDFKIDKYNNISNSGLTLTNGKKLSADRLENDLTNATDNVKSLTHRLDRVIQKLDTINGYVASNNFKKSNPSQDALTDFAISCLSSVNNELKESDLTPGTKIKNTYDDHIWVLNKIKSNDGLTTNKWEDFGSDNICVAGNDGVHGLVTGSQDKFKGFIDIKGQISINGLEEELNTIIASLTAITNDIHEYKVTTEARFSELEARLAVLER